MNEKFTRWSVFDDLETDTDIAAFLEACIEDNDYEFFMKALNAASRARGINEMAKKIGVPRESLYKSFSGKHKPNFETVLRAIGQLGFSIRIVPHVKEKPSASVARGRRELRLQA